jgi:RHS repeat-associated protein
MSPLGPSPHSGTSAPAGQVETPNTVIGINHGGALLNTTELTVPGSLSGVPLQFTRYYNSRDAEGFGELMGHGRTWTHSFSWRMTMQGSTAIVDFPSGRRLEFAQGGTTTYRGQSATLYAPPGGNGERIYKIGNFWHLDILGASAHTFERVVLPDLTVLYHPRESVDTLGNKLTYQTNAAARITQATDALGNSIDLTYSQITLNRKAAVLLHTVNSAPAVGWNEVTLSAGQPFRWFQGVSAPTFNFEVSEIEFYKNDGSGGYTKLSGTAYGTGPAVGNSNRTFDKAFDNNTSTRFSFSRPNHGIVGLDLGSTVTETVTKIRYHIPSAFSGELSKYIGMKFEGMTEQPETITVLAAVSASTGQSIEFEYGEHLDTSIDQTHAILEKVIYRNAANDVTDEAQLTWVTSQQGTSPSIRRAIEPRSTSETPDISFDYYPSHLAVKGQPAYVLAGDPAHARIIQVSDPKNSASFTAPDGGVHSIVNTNTSAYRPSSTTDAAGKTTSYSWQSNGFLASSANPTGTTTYTRNSRGQILTATRPDGLTTTHTYFATRLLSVTLSAPGLPSRTTTYTRDSNGRVTKTTFPDGSYEDYTYDANGLLTVVREKNGSFTVHTYDTTPSSPTAGLRLTTTRGLATSTATTGGETTSFDWHLPGNASGSPVRTLASVTDPRGRTTSYEYDHAGRVKKTTYPDGSYRQIDRDTFGNKIAEFDGSTLTEWTYDFFRRPLTHSVDTTPGGLNLTTTYDYGLNGTSCGCYGSGGPTLITSPAGRKTRLYYDLMGRLTSETQGFTTTEAATTSHTRDVLGRITSTTGPDGHVTNHTYDSMGRTLSTTIASITPNLVTTRTYSPFGDTLTTTAPGSRSTTMAYDSMSRAVTITDPLSKVTTITYNLAGNRTAITEAFGTASARTTAFAYDAYDRLTTTTYPDSTTTSQTYHPGGELASSTDELGRTTTSDTTLVTWTDSLSNTWTSFASTSTDPALLTTTSYGPPMSLSGGTQRAVSPMGRVSESYIDADGRTILTRSGLVASGSSLTADVTDTVMTYDGDGNMLSSTTDPTGLNLTTSRSYDALNRVITSTDPLSRLTQYFYDKRGNLTKTKLPDNREQLSTYDALSRMVTSTDPKNQTITYTYWYETGNTLTLQDAKNQTTTWSYNLRGQLLTKVYANGNTHTYTYDALGRVHTHKTPKNETCTYTYDVRDRQTLANWNTTTPDTARDYWANGLVKSVDNGVSKSDYTYNVRNHLTSETQTLAGQTGKVVSYTYDGDGLRLQMNSPSGSPVDYTWTAKGQLNVISRDGPPPLATYTYDKAGRLDLLSHENTISEDPAYDAASQLLSRIHKKAGTTVSGHNYVDTSGIGYDATGRRTLEIFADGTTAARTYGYDLADQVSSATYGGGLSDAYNYDAMGNRSTASLAINGGATTTYTANNANQYTSISGMSAPVHDPNGNLTFQNGVTYTWDSENRLLSVTDGTTTNAYTYDGLHRRVTKRTTVSGIVTKKSHYLYNGWNVIEERTNSDTTTTFNLSTFALTLTLTWGTDLSGSLQGAGGVGGLLMVEEISGSTTTAYHFHYDGNGNVTEITDSSGNNAATYRYDAFGNALVSTGTYATINKYRFSTKPIDVEIATAPLYYYGYRYYAPLTGRWPSRDPIEEEGGLNLYGFVGNDALAYVDILGLQTKDPNGLRPWIPIYDNVTEATVAGSLYALNRSLSTLAKLQADFDAKSETDKVGKTRPRWMFEYCGRVCCDKQQKTFYFTEARTDRNMNLCYVGMAPKCKEELGHIQVGEYHNHPSGWNGDLYTQFSGKKGDPESGGDIGRSEKYNLTTGLGYEVNGEKFVKVYDPNSNMTEIWKKTEGNQWKKFE